MSDLIITAERFNLTDKSTVSNLYIDGLQYSYLLEDPVREQKINGEWVWRPEFKIPGKTAIPSGRYPVIVNRSQRFKRDLPLLLNVPDFVGVRIHTGNDEEDTEGCPLPGMEWNSQNPNWVSRSRDAFDPLFAKISEQLNAGGNVWMELNNHFT